MRSHWLALVFLLVAAPAWSADCAGVDLSADLSIKPDWTRYADDLVNGEGLLWRIEKPGVEPSFLFGSLHYTDVRAITVAAETEPYVKHASILATEIGHIDRQAKADADATLLRNASEPNRDTFDGLIDGEDAGRVETMLMRAGIDRERAHHEKLWLLLLYANWPACEAERTSRHVPTVDDFLVSVAIANHVEVTALTSLGEYDEALQSITDKDAATELKLLARSDSFLADAYATALSLYEQKRPGATGAFIQAQPRKTELERQSDDNIVKIMGLDLNDTLVGHAKPLLEKGGAFLAVTEIHLPGRRGLVEQFRAMGYTVTKVW